MRVVIDARWIFRGLSGVGRYTEELIGALLALGSGDEFVLLHNDVVVEERLYEALDLGAYGNVRIVHVPYGVFSVRNQLSLGRLLRRLGADVFHSTNYMVPLFGLGGWGRGRVACVCTIHDLIPLLFRDHAPRSRKARFFLVYRWLMGEVVRRVDGIVTVSVSSRRDILEAFDVPGGRVHVVYNGLSGRFVPSDVVKERVVLYVGRLDPYKNVPLLVEAFVLLAGRLGDVRLVLVAEEDVRYPEAGGLVDAAGLGGRVSWVSGLSDEALVEVYRRAAVTVLPSRYEGFGLPVAESMACGTPVVCSRCSSLPEVGGDAVLYLEEEDAGVLADLLERVLSDVVLAGDLRERGLVESARFRWRVCAEETLAVYRGLC